MPAGPRDDPYWVQNRCRFRIGINSCYHRRELHEFIRNGNRQARIDKNRRPWDKDWCLTIQFLSGKEPDNGSEYTSVDFRECQITPGSDLFPFHEFPDAGVVNSELAAAELKFKDRIVTPLVTFSLFLLLVASSLPADLKNSVRRRSRLACSIKPIHPSAPRHRTSDP
jgi:hypothetical protein